MHMLIFGADKISLESLEALQGSTPDILSWAAPILIVLILAEYVVDHIQNRKCYETKETLGSLLVGAGNALTGLLLKVSLFYVLVYFYNAVPWRMELNWWTFIPCYIVFDFFSYWAHYISHRQRFWWATHVVHHSSEHYNLTVAFRLSWVEYLKMIFLFPVSLCGFHPVIILFVHQVTVLYQFWVHTEYIPRLHPWIEYIFVTPSSHRVHHGSQEKYRNKNYGATFILWDRLFGTYQREEEQAVFGITHNLTHKLDPIHINFHEYADMLSDVKKAKGLHEKLFFIFGDPTMIAEVKKKHPLNNPTNPHL